MPEAEPAVGEIRLAHDSSAAHGVPAHITVLFPFLAPAAVDEDALQGLFAAFEPFDFTLDRVEGFDDGLVWLHPHPTRPFVDLTAAVAQRWPEAPPYEGAFDEVIPHLTVSEVPLDLSLPLPLAARAREVVLIEEDEASRRWSVRRRFPLGQSGVA